MKTEARQGVVGTIVFFCILAVLGAVLGVANVRSNASIRSESARKQSDTYVPQCDGKDMHPHDACVRTGAGSGSSSTYEELVAQHEKDITVDGIRSLHTLWRDVGFGATVLFLLLSAILSFFVRPRRKPSATPAQPSATPAQPPGPPAILG